MVADRFPDIIRELRLESVAKANASGHNIATNNFNFRIMRDYVPILIDDDHVWQELCRVSMLVYYCNFVIIHFQFMLLYYIYLLLFTVLGHT